MVTTTTAFTWDNLTESPWVKAVYAVLGDLPDPMPPLPDPRDFVFASRMPIPILRLFLDALLVPDTSHLAELFTRRVGENLYSYFQRNSWAAVDRTAEDLQFRYVYNWRHGDVADSTYPNRRTAIDFFVTPSPVVETVDEEYLSNLATWLRWVLPYFEGQVDCTDGDPDEGLRERIQVFLTTHGEPPLELDVAGEVTISVNWRRQ